MIGILSAAVKAAESAFYWNAETDAGARATARVFFMDMIEPPESWKPN
jgi:hypothetical protein